MIFHLLNQKSMQANYKMWLILYGSWDSNRTLYRSTHSRPMESRCCPMSRTISWSVWVMRGPGGDTSPLRAAVEGASPFTCVPLAHGWCMAGGENLRDLLRGGRPAPSSPESVEARLGAWGAGLGRRGALTASTPSPDELRPRDVTSQQTFTPAYLFVRERLSARAGTFRATLVWMTL